MLDIKSLSQKSFGVPEKPMNKNKYTLVELYGSALGHPLKNIELFSPKKIREKYNYDLLVDKGIRKKSLTKWFFKASDFYSIDISEKVKLREKEFFKLFSSLKNTKIVFLTSLEWDVEAFLNLVKKGISKIIAKNNLEVLIHSGFGLHFSFIKHRDILVNKKEFKRIHFSFFSEIQTHIAKKLFPSLNFYTLYMPHYKTEKNSENKAEFLSYTGVFSIYKNPVFVSDLTKKLNKEKFFIQLYFIDESNLLLAKKFFETKNALCLFRKLTGEEYKKILSKTKYGLLPYNKYEYSARASGLFEEYLMSGIPAFVTDGTWMAFKLRSYGLEETIFDGKLDDFLQKYKDAERIYEYIKEKWLISGERARKKRSFKSFFKNLEMILSEGKDPFPLQVVPEESVKNGIVNFFVKGGLYYLESGNRELSQTFFQMLKAEPQGYRDYDYLKERLNGSIGEVSYYSFFLNEENENINTLKKNWHRFSLFSLSKKGLKILKEVLMQPGFKDFINHLKENSDELSYFNSLIFYLFYHAISNELNSESLKLIKHLLKENKIPIEKLSQEQLYLYAKIIYFIKDSSKLSKILKALLRKKNLSYLKKIIKEDLEGLLSFIEFMLKKGEIEVLEMLLKRILKLNEIKEKFIFNYYLAIIYRAKKRNKLALLYSENVLKSMWNGELFYKHQIKVYNMISLLKSMGKIEEAKNLFLKFTKKKPKNELLSGAYFHLGEIALSEGRKKEAKEHFEKCLTLNPSHKKAKELLIKINSGG